MSSFLRFCFTQAPGFVRKNWKLAFQPGRAFLFVLGVPVYRFSWPRQSWRDVSDQDWLLIWVLIWCKNSRSPSPPDPESWNWSLWLDPCLGLRGAFTIDCGRFSHLQVSLGSISVSVCFRFVLFYQHWFDFFFCLPGLGRCHTWAIRDGGGTSSSSPCT